MLLRQRVFVSFPPSARSRAPPPLSFSAFVSLRLWQRNRDAGGGGGRRRRRRSGGRKKKKNRPVHSGATISGIGNEFNELASIARHPFRVPRVPATSDSLWPRAHATLTAAWLVEKNTGSSCRGHHALLLLRELSDPLKRHLFTPLMSELYADYSSPVLCPLKNRQSPTPLGGETNRARWLSTTRAPRKMLLWRLSEDR